MDVLELEHVSFAYPGGQQALEDISLQIRQGEFLVVCGQSGCGKTTLLKMLKPELAPHGQRQGVIRFAGQPLEELPPRVSAGEIGFVGQNPNTQTLTHKVWHELAFGLESLGCPSDVMRRQVAETASFFGMQTWFRREVKELSGGQKQLLQLASVLVMRPRVLILDEPTAQLDPIAASEFLASVYKLNRELGLTVILTEHRLEEVFPMADRVLMLDHGRKLLLESPAEAGRRLRSTAPDHPMLAALPSAVRIYQELDTADVCPLTVKEGKEFLSRHFLPYGEPEVPAQSITDEHPVVLEAKEAWFRYQRDLPDVLRGVSLQVRQGELFAILGGNGSGKTTLLNLLAGLREPYRGKVLVEGQKTRSFAKGSLYRRRLALLPQDPQTVFLKKTVREDLREITRLMGTPESELEAMAEKLGIHGLLDRHPYDLSGGEQQKAALAKVLLLQPRVLLLDEPTKGIDPGAKEQLARILLELQQEGLTTVLVTHDVEFAALSASRCALFFDGEVVSQDAPTAFFAQNHFYTTAASRMARHLYPQAVTCHQVARLCRSHPKKGEEAPE